MNDEDCFRNEAERVERERAAKREREARGHGGTHARCPHYWPIHREPEPGACACPGYCECRHEQDGCGDAAAPGVGQAAFDRFLAEIENHGDPEDLKTYREHFARAREEIKARRGGK